MPLLELERSALAYDVMGPPDGEPMVLVMGLGVQLIGWRPDFCRRLTALGYRLIRFDNRDIGLSSRHQVPPPKLVHSYVKRRLGLRARVPYTLFHMSRDLIALLDHLGIAAAHLVGASMGSMIAQTLAIHAPHRVKSLCSISSSAATLGRASSWGLKTRLMRLSVDSRPERSVDAQLEVLRLVGSRRWFSETRARCYFEEAHARAADRSGVRRQLAAVVASHDRTMSLRRLRIPAVVLHGSADPLISPLEGWSMASALALGRFRLIEHMGHDLPEEVWPTVIGEIDETASRAFDLCRRRRAA